METSSSVATPPKPSQDEQLDCLSGAPRFDGGFLVKLHPFELHSSLIRLAGNRFVIGRDPQNQLQLQDGVASRYHAVIERQGETYEISDLRSTNGLFVNQQRVSKAILQNGDRIRIGEHIFKYLSAGHAEAEYHETVYSMMTRDGLTGLFNKRYFADALERELDRAARLKHPLSLAFLDIDHFKMINDTHGHLSGDEALQEFAQRVTQASITDSVLARLGGEEFGLILAECGMSEAWSICEKARLSVASIPFSTSAGPIPITVSIGLTRVSAGATDAKTLAAEADRLLYESKRAGRNRTTAQEFAARSHCP